MAARLIGSFGLGEQDAVSDLDPNLLKADAGGALLADLAVRGGTTAARRALFEQFADPLVIHENPLNAPGGSSLQRSKAATVELRVSSAWMEAESDTTWVGPTPMTSATCAALSSPAGRLPVRSSKS